MVLKNEKYLVWPQKLLTNQYLSQYFTKMSQSHKILNDLGHLSEVEKVKFSFRYSNIFVIFLRIFEYIRDIKIQYLYSNIRYSAETIRIFEYSSRTGW